MVRLLHACFFIALLLPTSTSLPIARFALADSPCVRFDVVQMTAATNASTPEFFAANPGEKLIHVRIPVSSLVRLESEGSLLQYLYLITGSSSPFQIVDYAPRTTLGTDITGSISLEKNNGESATVGLKALTPRDFPIKADASANRNVSNSNSRRLEKLPPKQLLAASGTLHRGASAYFKLKPSTQTTLEGDKLFEITARVPDSWRAGLLQVNCAAFAKSRGHSDNHVVCGRNQFVVGVYMSGDELARERVWKLSETQQQLLTLAHEHADTIKDRRFPSLGHKIGAAFSVVKPRIPNEWLDQLLISDEFHSFERHLPRKVRFAATQYREARKQVTGFAG